MNFEIKSQRIENIFFRTRTELKLKLMAPN